MPLFFAFPKPRRKHCPQLHNVGVRPQGQTLAWHWGLTLVWHWGLTLAWHWGLTLVWRWGLTLVWHWGQTLGCSRGGQAPGQGEMVSGTSSVTSSSRKTLNPRPW